MVSQDLLRVWRQYLRQRLEMGEREIYRPFNTVSGKKQDAPAPVAVAADNITPVTDFTAARSLSELYQLIKDCQKCPLGKTRTNFVFGVGRADAQIMFVGEAPGHDEDMKGEPFVGRAGQLFNRILAAMNLRREDVYIGNVLKCRPPNNRDPLPEEAETCEPYLFAQIKLIRPLIICCLGRIAAQRLLRTNMTLGQMRQRWFNFPVESPGKKRYEAWLMVTYHPAALLRSPQYKKPLWEDMQKLMEKLAELR